MSTEVVLESIHTGKRYKVVSFDKEAKTVTLIGPHNRPFVEPSDKARFEKMGYVLKQVEAEAPPPPTTAPPPPSTLVVNA